MVNTPQNFIIDIPEDQTHRQVHKFSDIVSDEVTYRSLNGFNIYGVIMAFFHNIVSIMVLKDDDWYKQPCRQINSFKPESNKDWKKILCSASIQFSSMLDNKVTSVTELYCLNYLLIQSH